MEILLLVMVVQMIAQLRSFLLILCDKCKKSNKTRQKQTNKTPSRLVGIATMPCLSQKNLLFVIRSKWTQNCFECHSFLFFFCCFLLLNLTFLQVYNFDTPQSDIVFFVEWYNHTTGWKSDSGWANSLRDARSIVSRTKNKQIFFQIKKTLFCDTNCSFLFLPFSEEKTKQQQQMDIDCNMFMKNETLIDCLVVCNQTDIVGMDWEVGREYDDQVFCCSDMTFDLVQVWGISSCPPLFRFFLSF